MCGLSLSPHMKRDGSSRSLLRGRSSSALSPPFHLGSHLQSQLNPLPEAPQQLSKAVPGHLSAPALQILPCKGDSSTPTPSSSSPTPLKPEMARKLPKSAQLSQGEQKAGLLALSPRPPVCMSTVLSFIHSLSQWAFIECVLGTRACARRAEKRD